MLEINEFLTDTKGVAKLASVSPRTIQTWVAERRIPVIRLSARCVRFNKQNVLRAIERFTVKEVAS